MGFALKKLEDLNKDLELAVSVMLEKWQADLAVSKRSVDKLHNPRRYEIKFLQSVLSELQSTTSQLTNTSGEALTEEQKTQVFYGALLLIKKHVESKESARSHAETSTLHGRIDIIMGIDNESKPESYEKLEYLKAINNVLSQIFVNSDVTQNFKDQHFLSKFKKERIIRLKSMGYELECNAKIAFIKSYQMDDENFITIEDASTSTSSPSSAASASTSATSTSSSSSAASASTSATSTSSSSASTEVKKEPTSTATNSAGQVKKTKTEKEREKELQKRIAAAKRKEEELAKQKAEQERLQQEDVARKAKEEQEANEKKAQEAQKQKQRESEAQKEQSQQAITELKRNSSWINLGTTLRNLTAKGLVSEKNKRYINELSAPTSTQLEFLTKLETTFLSPDFSPLISNEDKIQIFEGALHLVKEQIELANPKGFIYTVASHPLYPILKEDLGLLKRTPAQIERLIKATEAFIYQQCIKEPTPNKRVVNTEHLFSGISGFNVIDMLSLCENMICSCRMDEALKFYNSLPKTTKPGPSSLYGTVTNGAMSFFKAVLPTAVTELVAAESDDEEDVLGSSNNNNNC